MKRIRISSLMDEYTDTEFFPAGGSSVSPGTVKERVLAEAKASAPREKKPMPRKKKVLLAAALAAVLVVLAGAGFPYIQHRLVGGTLSFEQTSSSRTITFTHDGDGEIVSCEDGRLIFNQGDERIDITDLVSEETPYIYDGSDPDTGMTYYVIMGGTPKTYGCLEWTQTPYPFDDKNPGINSDVEFDENGNPVIITNDFMLIDSEMGRSGYCGIGAIFLEDFMKLPWLLNGMEYVGIAFQDAPEDVTVVSEIQ